MYSITVHLFRLLIEKHKKQKGYNCIVAYSGGKDSTYLLHLLKNEYKLRILAYSYDNWFQSEQASKNITNVLTKLSIDHFTIRPAFETIRIIIKTTAKVLSNP